MFKTIICLLIALIILRLISNLLYIMFSTMKYNNRIEHSTKNTELFRKLQSALIEDKVLYGAFVASIESAIKEFPPHIDRECVARRIADRIIGREE